MFLFIIGNCLFYNLKCEFFVLSSSICYDRCYSYVYIKKIIESLNSKNRAKSCRISYLTYSKIKNILSEISTKKM